MYKEAVDGPEVLEKPESDQCKLIISDWNKLNMMGIDRFKTMRSSEDYKTAPFLMGTAESKKENVIGAMRTGFQITASNRSLLTH